MRPTSKPSRDRMLEAAESILMERGLSGAGIKQVVELGGAPIGSVYHHFPGGKTELVAEALAIHGEKARRFLDSAFAGAEPLPDRLRGFFRRAAEGFDQGGGHRSCAIGTVTLDLGEDEAELRRRCRGVFDGWVETIASHLPWHDERKRLSFAEMVVSTMEGAFVLSRARGSGKPFLVVGNWLAKAAETEGHTGAEVDHAPT